MIIKNWIVLGAAVSAILVYTIGIPPSFSAEYSKSAQYTVSENNCGNTQAVENSAQYISDYESLVDNTATYCANTDSEIQGEDNSATQYSSQR